MSSSIIFKRFAPGPIQSLELIDLGSTLTSKPVIESDFINKNVCLLFSPTLRRDNEWSMVIPRSQLQYSAFFKIGLCYEVEDKDLVFKLTKIKPINDTIVEMYFSEMSNLEIINETPN